MTTKAGTALALIEGSLVPVTNAPRQIQTMADTLVDVDCCTPRVIGARMFNVLGNDTTWEIEVVHELVANDADGKPYRHGRRTICRISSFDG